MGRLMGLLMLAGFGIFPISVLLAGLVVHNLGSAIFFPLAAAVLTTAVLAAWTQPRWRNFGTTTATTPPAQKAEVDRTDQGVLRGG
jgi:hypothetical protein